MPLYSRSSRTTWVKRAAWDLAASERAAKSAMAMRGFASPSPVAILMRSWAAAECATSRIAAAKSSGLVKFPRFSTCTPQRFETRSSRKTALLLHQREIEIKGHVHVGPHVIVGERAERVNALQGPQSRIVHGWVAAALGHANIRNGAIRADSECHRCMGAAGRPYGRINGGLIPGLAEPVTDRIHIPKINRAQVSASLTPGGDTPGCAGGLGIT